ncbi:MAG: DegT/DnrJ/EryC1/StrS family aminotransferase [Archangiaceae bacterium]|nr:DegT/DnrJ/EryC1/StrS family aminotransferase [Archangiaceae bacterium]
MPRLRDVLYSGQISEGEPVARFERLFGEWVGAEHTLSFYSGTAALHAAFHLVGAGAGDEIITTAMTAEPTNTAIAQTGARPVWADVDPRNGNVTGASVEAVLSPKTKAIVVVHYGGIPVPLDEVRAVARKAGVPLIEDAAHALGAKYDGKLIGTGSDFVMFSLQAIKHMTTVDGGMRTVRDPEVAHRGRLLKWFGMDRAAPRTELDVKSIGFKYHMNNVNAVIGLVQLEFVRDVIARYVSNGKFFDAALRGIPGLELCRWDPKAEPTYWFYTVFAERRDDLARKLTERGIGNGLVHKRNDRHSLFASSRRGLPGLDRFWANMLHIPCGFWVTDEDRERIAATLREGW